MRTVRRTASGARSAALGAVIGALILSAGCAASRLPLQSDPGTPFPEFQNVLASTTSACRPVRTFTAELSLSGRAGGQRLRGRVIAGFERPASMRLEAVAPFGPPGFILAARGDATILLLPRDERVLRGSSAAEVLAALTGVDLAPQDLQAILTGCLVPEPLATAGRRHADGWTSIDLDGGATMYLRQQDGAWQLQGARRGTWEIEYGQWQGRFPRLVRLRSGNAEVDLTASLTQLEANVDIDPAAFTVTVPASAAPISLEELRAAGPLRGAS